MKIALIGTMRSGKDTVADILTELAEFEVFRFADGITDVIDTYFPEVLSGGKPRQHYQLIGQTFRELDENVWVKDLHSHRQFVGVLAPCENELITDVRQLNELQYCLDHGFTMIKVHAAYDVRRKRIEDCGDVFDPEQFHHETEVRAAEMWSEYTIYNNGTMDELVEQVHSIYKQLLEEEQ